MSKKLIVKRRGKVYAVPLEKIILMEKCLRKISIHTTLGMFDFYGKFKEIIPSLDERFLCCHRSYIINMDEIVAMNYKEICFTNGKRIYFGRDKCRKALEIFGEYISKKIL